MVILLFFLIGVWVGYIIKEFYEETDNDAATRQQIFDGLTKLKSDIENTVN